MGKSSTGETFGTRQKTRKHEVSATPLFKLGQVVCTPGSVQLMNERGVDPNTLLLRHVHGDWGAVDSGTARDNKNAVKTQYRVHSAYDLQGGGVIWIITEFLGSITTILLPEEY